MLIIIQRYDKYFRLDEYKKVEFKINFQLQILNCCEDMVRNVSSNLQSNKYKHMKLSINSSNYLTFGRGEFADNYKKFLK